MLSSNKKRSPALSLSDGFTLIELMVVIALITILASIFLSGRNKYTERLNLKTQSYTLASFIRQAQSYSLGVRADAGNFNASYGVSVDKNNPSLVVFFTDRNKNGKYDSSGGEAVDSYNMTDGTQVSDLCGFTSGSENCNNIDRLDVTFVRPSPAAAVKLLNSGGVEVSSRVPPGKIYLQSPGGERMTLTVDSTGQISIQ